MGMAIMTNVVLTVFVGSQTEIFMSYPIGGSAGRFRESKLWVVAIVLEHVILGARWLIYAITPNVPAWVPKAKMQIGIEHETLLLTADQARVQSENRTTFDEQNSNRESRLTDVYKNSTRRVGV